MDVLTLNEATEQPRGENPISERLNSDAKPLLTDVLNEPEFAGYATSREILIEAFPDQALPALQRDFNSEIQEILSVEAAEERARTVNRRIGILLNFGLTLVFLYLLYAVIGLPLRYKNHAKFLLLVPSHRTQASLY